MSRSWLTARTSFLVFPKGSPTDAVRSQELAAPGGVLKGLSLSFFLKGSGLNSVRALSWLGCARWLAGAGLIAGLSVGLASAQLISVGVTGGVPVSPHSQDYGLGCTRLSCGLNDFFVKPYAFGPTVDVNLPHGISAEVGFLYERLHKDFTQGLVAPHGGRVNFGQQYSASADAWLIPLLLKYNFGRHRITPFVEAGATFRHLAPFDGKGIQFDDNLQPQPTLIHFDDGRGLDGAITAGAGLRWRISVIDIAPEIRFLHWSSENEQPARNQGMLMLGLSFPVRR